MEKLKFVLMLFFLSCAMITYPQMGYAIFSPQNHSKAYLYKSAYSKHIVDSIVNDSVAEVFYCVSINKARRNRALVSTFVDENKDGLTLHSGWIEWENLGIRLICDTINLRERPNENAKIVRMIISPAWIDLYPIKGAKNEWLYIYDKYKNIKGWVAPIYQCVNSYTTCN